MKKAGKGPVPPGKHENRQEEEMADKDKRKEEIISSAELKARNEPVLDQRAEDFSRYTFWQYTRTDSIKYILGGGCFWVNSISGMNDVYESRLHEDRKADIFVQSFCNSDTEKIPMSYLYGGITGKGASIGFTPDVMRSYIRSIRYVTELTEKTDGGRTVFEPGERLEIGKDFELRTGWVFYTKYRRDESGNADRKTYARVCHRNTFYNVEDPDAFFTENYFIKDYPWEYEKEFRIVLINLTGREIKKIKIDLPEEFRTKKNRKIKVRLGPEISCEGESISGETDYERCRREILEKAERKDGESYQVSVQKSGLGVHMDLLSRNQEDLNTYIGQHPEYLYEKTREKAADSLKKH